MRRPSRFLLTVALLMLIAGQVLAHGDEDFGDQTFKIEQLPIVVVYVTVAIGCALLAARLILWKTNRNEKSPNDSESDSDKEDTLEN